MSIWKASTNLATFLKGKEKEKRVQRTDGGREEDRLSSLPLRWHLDFAYFRDGVTSLQSKRWKVRGSYFLELLLLRGSLSDLYYSIIPSNQRKAFLIWHAIKAWHQSFRSCVWEWSLLLLLSLGKAWWQWFDLFFYHGWGLIHLLMSLLTLLLIQLWIHWLQISNMLLRFMSLSSTPLCPKSTVCQFSNLNLTMINTK